MANDYRKLVILVVLAFVAISLILQIVGFTTPGWQVTKHDVISITIEIYLGLWYIRNCIADKCTTYTLSEFDDFASASTSGGLQTDTQDHMLEADIETSIALFACLVAIVTAVIWFLYRRRNNRIPAITCQIACMISGVLCLVAAGRYGDDQRKKHNDLKDLFGSSPYKAPYALILTGIGGIIIIIASFLCLVAMCLYDNESRRRPTYYPPPQETRRDYIPAEKMRTSYQHEPVRQPYQEYVRPHYPEPVRHSVRETPIIEPLRHSRPSYRQSGGDVVYVKYDPSRGSSHLSSSKNRHY